MESVVVAAGIIFHEGKVLITRRKKDSHIGNYWEFPGGKMNEGEDLSACLVREVREETGIGIKVGEEILSVAHQYSDRRIDLHFFSCAWESGKIEPIGCEEYLWIEKNALDQFSFPPANSELIEKLKYS
jgi:mutator protein MutT